MSKAEQVNYVLWHLILICGVVPCIAYVGATIICAVKGCH